MIRILIVDDNESIHNDFKKVLQGKSKDKLRNVEMALFGDDDPDFEMDEPTVEYEIDDAFQGEEAIEKVDQAAAEGRPYAMIFMDVRMPPGMDGIQASARIWEKHPSVELVICTAHSDYSWGEMVKEIGASDKLQFLRKPFDMVTVQQMALACVKKHEAIQQEQERLERLRNENERQRETQRTLVEAADQINAHVNECKELLHGLEVRANGLNAMPDPQEVTLFASEFVEKSQLMLANLNHISAVVSKSKDSMLDES